MAKAQDLLSCQLLTNEVMVVVHSILLPRRPRCPAASLHCTLSSMAEVIPIGSDHAGYQLKEWAQPAS
jgi:hypothetical protein